MIWFRSLSLALAMLCGSCNTLPTHMGKPGACEIALVIWLRAPMTAQYQYFTVEDGTFAYGGGRDALNLKTSWQTDLSPQQCAVIVKFAEEGGWLAENPPAGGCEKGAPCADIAVSGTSVRQQFVLPGENPTVVAVTDYLVKIADVRFQQVLDRLPEAGEQPR
ncbi:MAG: hypothetical protein EXS01_00270 [Phycisphaerales bacterium]|nr:hypothetical protein [Phycisphaerales bacterium]